MNTLHDQLNERDFVFLPDFINGKIKQLTDGSFVLVIMFDNLSKTDF